MLLEPQYAIEEGDIDSWSVNIPRFRVSDEEGGFGLREFEPTPRLDANVVGSAPEEVTQECCPENFGHTAPTHAEIVVTGEWDCVGNFYTFNFEPDFSDGSDFTEHECRIFEISRSTAPPIRICPDGTPGGNGTWSIQLVYVCDDCAPWTAPYWALVFTVTYGGFFGLQWFSDIHGGCGEFLEPDVFDSGFPVVVNFPLYNVTFPEVFNVEITFT